MLAGVRGLGPVGFGALLRRYGSGRAILLEAASPGGIERLTETTLDEGIDRGGSPTPSPGDRPRHGHRRSRRACGATLRRIEALGLRIVTIEDAAYPSRLAAVEMPPHVLYVLGEPAALGARSAVAIVGTRRATDAGRRIAARIAADLVAVGASVISGLAVGIDGAAHAAAVRARGTTVAVIGSGHGDLHPRAHARLAASIVAAGGAIVSELAPDVAPSRGTSRDATGSSAGSRTRPWSSRRRPGAAR